MGISDFFRKLVGRGGDGSSASASPSDPKGIYLYAQCGRCGTIVRVRADKQNDLNSDGSGYVWHKTIVDSKCFQRMQAVVNFDGYYTITDSTLTGGEFVSAEAYAAQEARPTHPPEEPPVEE
jgi:hypothetical protein